MAIKVSEMYEYGGFWSPYVLRPGRGMTAACSLDDCTAAAVMVTLTVTEI